VALKLRPQETELASATVSLSLSNSPPKRSLKQLKQLSPKKSPPKMNQDIENIMHKKKHKNLINNLTKIPENERILTINE
jgi:hypothetical protein